MSATPMHTIHHRVLVIEDDQDWLDFSKMRLEKKGFMVGIAQTRDEAIERLGQCLYHVAIVDLKLDEKDPGNREGLRVLEHIWKMDEGTRAIVRSGFASEISVINEMIKYGIKGLTEKDMAFVTDSANKGTEDASGASFFNAVEIAANEAQREIQRASARTVWESSPFSFINGMLARDIQMKMGAGRMSELRNFLGELVESYAPWLQAKDQTVLRTIEIEQPGEPNTLTAGYQTSCWSRTLGKAVVIRFGRKDCYDECLNLHPVQETTQFGVVRQKLWDRKSEHFTGEVYLLDNAEFQEKFRSPTPKRAPEH
jgi:ActR/RegA family two-component response regulator